MNAMTLSLPQALARAAAAHERGDLDDAERLCREILDVKADYFDALHLLAVVQSRRGQRREALASCDQALALRPDHAEALNNRGIALKDLKRFDEAVASYDRALAIRPNYAKAFYNRGVALYAMNRWRDALASHAQAVNLRPNYAAAKFALCMSELPILYASQAEIGARRAAYERRLRDLCGSTDGGVGAAELAQGLGSSQPYYLACQGENDRDLQARYGALACRIMAARCAPAALAPPPANGESLRVGFVSGFFRQHSNWKIPIKGWLSQLDRRRFRVFGYHTGTQVDAETKAANDLCDRFVQGPLPIERWRDEIAADAPYVLIYPEIGMDAVAPALAAQRLAPVQCNSWGHPDTSGFPTLDYYLSSELMEPPDGDDHYTERLVRLPNLSIYCEPTALAEPTMTRRDHGLRPDATCYWCGQSASKYLPQYDEVFPRVAGEIGDCQFVFVRHPGGREITALFRERLGRAFGALGLKADDHCVFLPRMAMTDYVAAIGLCDVFLDSIGWSGCNTTLESLAHDLPIVTMPGPLMRGRHSMAILKMMGITETIAETVDAYVATAVRLTRDAPWRTAIKAKIAANKHRVYRDRASIEGLEQFLDRVGRRR